MFQFSTVDIRVSVEWIIASLSQVNCVQDCQQYRKNQNGVRQKKKYIFPQNLFLCLSICPPLYLSHSPTLSLYPLRNKKC